MKINQDLLKPKLTVAFKSNGIMKTNQTQRPLVPTFSFVATFVTVRLPGLQVLRQSHEAGV